MTIKLNCRTAKDITLNEALANCQDILNPTEKYQTVALLYAPDRCRFAAFVDGQLRDEKGDALSEQALRNIFEARVFNCAAELRWLHTGNHEGNAALLSEQDISTYLQTNLTAESEFEKLDELDSMEQCYLLWGEGTGISPSPGWQRLTAARIGRLNVPLRKTVTSGMRVQLHSCEYLREVDCHGNVAVVEERLLKLEVAQ
jgi:CRISPR-associated protein (TIGR03984 family)